MICENEPSTFNRRSSSAPGASTVEAGGASVASELSSNRATYARACTEVLARGSQSALTFRLTVDSSIRSSCGPSSPFDRPSVWLS